MVIYCRRRDLGAFPESYDSSQLFFVMVYKFLNGVALLYLQEKRLSSIRRPNQQLRTSDATTLEVPLAKSNWNERAFGVAAPKLWNALLSSLRARSSVDVFIT